MLLHIADLLAREQVSRIRAQLDTANWTDGRETVGVQGAQVKRNQQLPDASPLRLQLSQLILRALAGSPLYHAATLPLRTLPPCLNHDESGAEYGFHVNGAAIALSASRAP